MKRFQDVLSLLWLCLAGFLCYGAGQLERLGFYHDDWTILAYLHFAPAGFFSKTAALAHDSPALLYRPGELPIYAGLYSLFGAHPLPWQLTMLALNVLLAYAVFCVLLRHGAPRSAALLGGLLFLAYPNKDATMFWPIVLVNSFSLLFYCLAYLQRLDYIETGDGMSLAAALGALLVCLSTYDQCVFLFLLWLIPASMNERRTRSRRLRSFVAAAIVTGIWFGYKFLVVPYVFGVAYNKTVIISPTHFGVVYWRGVDATVGPRLIRYVFESAGNAFRTHPWAAIAAVLLPWAALFLDDPSSAKKGKGDASLLILLGAALFLLGYLPIALSDYIPTPINHLNRINQTSALGFVIVLVGCALRFLRPRQWIVAGCGVGALLLAAHVQFASVWAEAYRRQMEVREMVLRFAPQWPADATLMVLPRGQFIAEKAPVFLANWDITGAVQIWMNDVSRKADIIDERTDFRSDAIYSRGVAIPYAAARMLDVRNGIFTKIEPKNFRRLPG